MSRYIRRLRRVGSLGPTEERGAGLWVGYDLIGIDADLSALGLVKVDDWPEDRILQHGVTGFRRVEPDDHATHETLGLRRSG